MEEIKDGELNQIKTFRGPPDQTPAERLMTEGKAVMKVEAPYLTAMTVQKPRDIDRVQVAVLREAEYAGEDFFYSWTVKGKKGPQTIQGPSIGLAMCVAREWTNCAVDVKVEPSGTYDLFTAAFIDLERGFTAKRAFKQKKSLAPGRYDADRWEDMEFQKAQSKAIRNVIVSGVPRWLVNQAIEKAKDSALNKITKEGIEVATKKAISFLERYGVSEKRVIAKIRKPKNEWTSEDILVLRGCASELKDRQASVDELFPRTEPTEPETTTETPKTPPTTSQDAQGSDQTENATPDPDKAIQDEFKGLTGLSLNKFLKSRKTGIENFVKMYGAKIPTWPAHIQKIIKDKHKTVMGEELVLISKVEDGPRVDKTTKEAPVKGDTDPWIGLYYDCPDMSGNPIARNQCNPENPDHCQKLEGCPSPYVPNDHKTDPAI